MGTHSYFVWPDTATRPPSVLGETAKWACSAWRVTARLKVSATGESVGTSFWPLAMLSATEVGSVLR